MCICMHTYIINACYAYYANARGRGAADAAYDRAALVENTLIHALHLSGAAGDCVNCYNLAEPLMAFTAGLLLGATPAVVDADARFLAHATYTVRYAAGFGDPRTHLRGLGQGSALAEMWLGCLMYPWCAIIRLLNAIPRVLADDFGYVAAGPNHLQRTWTCTEHTVRSAVAIGGQLSLAKSLTCMHA